MKTAPAAPSIYVNDRRMPVPEEATVAGLVRELGLDGRKGVAVALNGSVVPRFEWGMRALGAGDRLLLIRATQGG
ncbi:MAG: sulfur carrier protein ThiS [Opitutaceae bacterium]|jgi:sulfur carrier protein